MLYRFDTCKFAVGQVVRIRGTETVGAVTDRVSPPFRDDGKTLAGREYEYRVAGVDPTPEEFAKGKVLLFLESELELLR